MGMLVETRQPPRVHPAMRTVRPNDGSRCDSSSTRCAPKSACRGRGSKGPFGVVWIRGDTRVVAALPSRQRIHRDAIRPGRRSKPPPRSSTFIASRPCALRHRETEDARDPLVTEATKTCTVDLDWLLAGRNTLCISVPVKDSTVSGRCSEACSTTSWPRGSTCSSVPTSRSTRRCSWSSTKLRPSGRLAGLSWAATLSGVGVQLVTAWPSESGRGRVTARRTRHPHEPPHHTQLRRLRRCRPRLCQPPARRRASIGAALRHSFGSGSFRSGSDGSGHSASGVPRNASRRRLFIHGTLPPGAHSTAHTAVP